MLLCLMKRKTIRGIITILCVSAILGGCGKRSEWDDYVKLGKYKGLELSVERAECSDQEAKNMANTYAAVKKGYIPAAKGDTCVVGYSCSVDGEELDFMSNDEAQIVLAENNGYIDGLAEAFIGMKRGEEKDVSIRLPEDYAVHAGEEALFHLTMQYIYEAKTNPSEEELQTAREEVIAIKKGNNEAKLRQEAWGKLVDEAEFKKACDEFKVFYRRWYDGVISERYGSINEYRLAYSMTKEDYEKEREDYAEAQMNSSIVASAVCDKNGIKDSDATYKEAKEAALSELTLEDKEPTEDMEMFADLRARYQCAVKLVVDGASVTEVDPVVETEGPAEETEGESR